MLASLNWPTSWDRLKEQALAPVTVAVLDSGVDGSHPDLAGRICGAFAVEVEGEPVVRERSPTANNDLFGHGTPVAGIIAAIAPNAQIYDLRVFSDKKVERDADFADRVRARIGPAVAIAQHEPRGGAVDPRANDRSVRTRLFPATDRGRGAAKCAV